MADGVPQVRCPSSGTSMPYTRGKCPSCKRSMINLGNPAVAYGKPEATFASSAHTPPQAHSAVNAGPEVEQAVRRHLSFSSKVFPGFPQHPLNRMPRGSVIDGQYLADIATVGSAIATALRGAKGRLTAGWPEYADGELQALERIYARMAHKAGIGPSIDSGFVRILASKYVSQLCQTADRQAEYLRGRLTNFSLSIDFANTIGYGGALKSALDFAERTAWP